MNKFNLLANPYSQQQLADMIADEISEVKEAFEDVQEAQVQLREAEHTLEMIQCQLNMVSLVAGKEGVLEALNTFGAVEAICEKKIEDITALEILGGLTKKLRDALAWVWQKLGELAAVLAGWLAKALNSNAYRISYIKNATEFKAADKKYKLLTVEGTGKVTNWINGLNAIETKIKGTIDKIKSSDNPDEVISHVNAAFVEVQSTIQKTPQCSEFITVDNEGNFKFDSEKFNSTMVDKRTLADAGIRDLAGAKAFVSNNAFVSFPGRVFNSIVATALGLAKSKANFRIILKYEEAQLKGDVPADQKDKLKQASDLSIALASMSGVALSLASKLYSYNASMLSAIYSACKGDEPKKVAEGEEKPATPGEQKPGEQTQQQQATPSTAVVPKVG